MQVLITAGPTYEPIDPIRYLGNRSTGLQGALLANHFATEGWHTTLVNGPNPRPIHSKVKLVQVETAVEMAEACEHALPVDVAICTAAVLDYRVAQRRDTKWRKIDGPMPPLELVENPDILALIANHPRHRPRLVIGFAGETEDIQRRTEDKLRRKRCDIIFGNDISPGTGALGGGTHNRLICVSRSEGTEIWETMTKDAIAARILQMVNDRLSGRV